MIIVKYESKISSKTKAVRRAVLSKTVKPNAKTPEQAELYIASVQEGVSTEQTYEKYASRKTKGRIKN
jgi:hypothetical protein